MTGHLRLLACNGHCAIALLPAQQLLGINSSPIQNGEYRESPVVGVVLESVYYYTIDNKYYVTGIRNSLKPDVQMRVSIT